MAENIIKTQNGEWEMVCGLEIHCQIISKSKIFSSASTEYGADANENVSFVDVAMPGMLPVLNEECVRQAVKTGLGLNAKINNRSVFSRKNYFYADLPQGYQITQYEYPLVGEGEVVIDLPSGETRKIGIERIHIEQDTGKSIHDINPKKSYIDYNRAGVGLMELVTKPDFRSAEEVGAFLKKLRSIVRYLGTCDGNMDEGSMRCDASVSVRPLGSSELRPRAEIKNVNSVKFVMQAIEYEAKRQVEVYENGGNIEQQTRNFDQNTGETKFLRIKENANEYRYFPEPDLPPLVLSDEFIESVKNEMCELPDAKKERFVKELKLTPYDASVLCENKETAEFFEKAATGRDAKKVANWVMGDFFAMLNAKHLSLENSPVSAENLGALVDLISNNTINGKTAKDVFAIMVQTGKAPDVIVEENGLKQVTDTKAIESIVDAIIKENPDNVAAYQGGKQNLMGWFVGQVMKQSKGTANPAMVNQILKEKLG
ncbi:MAG: Asp-tRNA(Asn)/Glu-tRNA(Gln) amidotransferase subunit GatB [Alphaproteobacteria bacterium]|nr:Asp-tRNA(Asn)/Glu-tRNA(Gln) amidotransferase subunit GatB [Alphaproteobacteria bacterium]MBQ2811049.1 Asp-tRNA(Asn)/Glu-tRNA(Gln) amidotransferase subunit GatB [Alphaproteobacteria bacterium]